MEKFLKIVFMYSAWVNVFINIPSLVVSHQK